MHLGGHSLPPQVVRERFGTELMIGVSTHSVAEVDRAARAGADFVTFGPVYPTPSKARYGPPLGVLALREACGRGTLPVFALGGVDGSRRAEVMAAGAAGVAVISAILGAESPRRAAEELNGPG